MTRTLLFIGFVLGALHLGAQTADDALRQFEGDYLFHGSIPYCEVAECTPASFYECSIKAVDGQLRLAGLVGKVDNRDFPYYTGTYRPDEGTVHFFCGEEHEGDNVYDASGYRYYIYDFTLQIGTDDEGRLTLTQPGTFYFYAYNKGNWPRATYAGFTLTKDAELPHWNGNINHLTTASTLDELLTYTLEFENAHKVQASGYDIQGFIFDQNGAPYAIAMVNGFIDAFGSLTVRENIATIRFVRFDDLNPQSQQLATSYSRLVGFMPPTPGQATVLFTAKSFKVDDTLIKEKIVKTFDITQ